MEKKATSCVEPAGGPVGAGESESAAQGKPEKEVVKVQAKVGGPAPDFEASAFVDGGFRNIKLSDYKGQWVALCFYPGDFTFV